MPSRPYNSKDVEPVVVQMNREIRTLLTEREAINKRIDAIKKALVGLATLVGDDVLKETLEHGERSSAPSRSGITKACRGVLMNAENPLLAKEVYEQVRRERPNLWKGHDAPMTSLYAVLSRLVKRGEIQVLANENGRRTWQWVHESCGQMKNESAEFGVIQ
jgi:Fe2+ or Zn2+ uptake regulation protein